MSDPTLSVIVPAHNSAATLPRCLDALRAAIGPADEIIVVDDASTDGWQPAHDERVRYLRLDERTGRGPARNVGANRATGDVIVFVDSDVVVHHDTLEAIRAAFRDDPERTSLIGAYDDRPGAPGVVSQYRNLLHHRIHHTSGTRAVHFWTGLGAVRDTVFRKIGGLDETDWAHDMEDVEFGHRLVDEGYAIDVMPHVQGTHLKRFTLRSMVATDVAHRAFPWASLMLRTGFRRNEFVLSARQTVSVAAAGITLAAAAGASARRMPVRVAVAGGAVFVAVNAPLWAFFAAKRGWRFALACVPLHFVHSLSSGTGFAVALGQQTAISQLSL
jgi:GT2 family glycosyltransferase